LQIEFVPWRSVTVNVRLLAAEIAGTYVVFGLALFVAAGTIIWPAGWTFLILFLGFAIALSRWLLRHNPGLLTERMTGIGKPNQPTWDRVFFVVIQVFFLGWLVLMALDTVRFHWSKMPGWVQVLGAVLMLGSFYLLFLIIPDISGKPFSVTRRSRPNRPRANGDIHRAVSLCAPSHVCCCNPLHGRHHPFAGLVVWVHFRADPCHRDSV